MDQDQVKPKQLTPLEETELREGQALYEMTQSAGWQIVTRWLEDRANHTWVDPRSIDKPGSPSKEEWEWRELNAFHAANNAKELLEALNDAISKADYLSKVKSGEMQRQMKGFKI